MYHDVSRRLETALMTPLTISGIEVYRIGEALETAGVSRPTYFRWVKAGRVSDTRFRDRNRRRVFTNEEVQQLVSLADRLIESSALPSPSASKSK